MIIDDLLNMNLNDITKSISKTKNKIIKIIKNIFIVLFSVAGICFSFFAVVFFVIRWIPIGFFFLIPAVISFIIAFFINKSKIPVKAREHHFDIKKCETLLSKIKSYAKNNSETYDIYSKLKNEVEEAKNISKKIDDIVKILNTPEWNIETIDETIASNKNNESLLKKLNEQRNNIIMLKDTEQKLRDQISNLKLSINSIYSRLTMIENSNINKKDFDQIETEIQKILDYKQKVIKFEQELDKEFGIKH